MYSSFTRDISRFHSGFDMHETAVFIWHELIAYLLPDASTLFGASGGLPE
jgi:hypothetical protein